VHFWLSDKLLCDFGKFEMSLVHDGKYAFGRNQSFRSLKGGLKHRHAAKELYVLLGQRVSAQPLDQGTEPDTFSSGHDDRASISNINFINWFAIHKTKVLWVYIELTVARLSCPLFSPNHSK
jgi:hypothetical protein